MSKKGGVTKTATKCQHFCRLKDYHIHSMTRYQVKYIILLTAIETENVKHMFYTNFHKRWKDGDGWWVTFRVNNGM